MADEHAGAAVPVPVDAVQPRRLAQRDEVLQLAAGPRLEAERERRPSGSVLAPEVEERAVRTMLDDELEPGRVAGRKERQHRCCPAQLKPSIIGSDWLRQARPGSLARSSPRPGLAGAVVPSRAISSSLRRWCCCSS